jgi:hypothetical protein
VTNQVLGADTQAGRHASHEVGAPPVADRRAIERPVRPGLGIAVSLVCSSLAFDVWVELRAAAVMPRRDVQPHIPSRDA